MSIDFSIRQQGVSPMQNTGFSSPSAAVGSLFGNAAAVVESPMSLLASWTNAGNAMKSTRPWRNGSGSTRS